MKKVFYFILTVVLAALVSCQKQDPEPVWVEIPYSVSTDITKVTYDGSSQPAYSQKAGDKLSIRGTSREDVSGILEYNNGENRWEGNLRYLESEGEPTSSTALTVTLVHADNADESTYGHGCLSVSTLTEAAEKLSLLTGSTTFGSTGTVTLTQQATFVQVTVSFDFIGTGTMVTGETSVDVTVGGETVASGTAEIVNVAAPGDPAEYQAHFFMALPGGTAITENDYVEICDRKAYLRNSGASSVTLAANTKYTLNRTIDFKPELGDPYWSDGTYGRIAHPSGVEIVGIIVYVNNNNSEAELAITESTHGGGHALVMALHNAAAGVAWGAKTKYTTAMTKPSQAVSISNVSGYANTLLEAGQTAADCATGYRSANNDIHTGHDSGWFLPSIGQWIYSLSDFASVNPMEQWTNGSSKNWLTEGSLQNDLVFVKECPQGNNLLVSNLNDRCVVLQNQFGCTFDEFGLLVLDGGVWKNADNYWTSSEYDKDNGIRFNLGSVDRQSNKYWSTFKAGRQDKSSTYSWKEECVMKVRPFLAF